MNYSECTLEEMIEHVLKMSGESITRMRVYYRRKGNLDVVNKIDKAREHANIVRLEQRLSRLKEKSSEANSKST